MEKAKSEALLMGRRASELLLGPVRKSIEKSPSSSLLARQRSSGGSPANSTTFKGVRMRAWGKWVTEIRDPETKDRIWLGSFATAEMAAMAYDAGMVCLKGESAYYQYWGTTHRLELQKNSNIGQFGPKISRP